MPAVVSVIIPTFNRCSLLERAIDSALAQTHEAIEVIVVDDGSTDGTAAMMADRYGADPRVISLRQANLGVAAARNRALDVATGDFVAFLDSDDVWRPWKLAVQVACLTRRPEAGMVWTDMEAIGLQGEAVAPRYLRQMYSAYSRLSDNAVFEGTERLDDIMAAPDGMGSVAVRWGRLAGPMIVGNLVHTSTVMMTRARLAQVGRFNGALSPVGEDYDFHLRCCEAGPVGLIDVPSIQYQTGLADRLTLNRHAMARNYLLTSAEALARTPVQERPPAAVLRQAQAAGHAWMGGVMLEQGDRAGARRHLLRSLCHDPFRVRQAAELAAATLPALFYGAARALKARQRQRQQQAWQDVDGVCSSAF